MGKSKNLIQKSSTAAGDNIVNFKTLASVTRTSLASQNAASGFGMTNASQITLPPGKYWIGDPHHALRKEIHEFNEMIQADSVTRTVYFPNEAKPDGKFGWYQFTETGDGCYQVQKNTLPNVQVSGSGFFKTPDVIGILPFDLTCDSAADYASGMTVTVLKAVTLSFEDGQLRFKSGKGELVIESVPDEYVALGVDLSYLASAELAERRLYLIGQINRFAHGLSGGYVGPAYMMDGYLQITVHSNENPYLVYQDFISKLDSREIDVPEDNPEGLVLSYALVSFIDFEDPIYCLKEMSGDGIHFSMSDKEHSSPDESLASRLLRDAESYEARAKEQEESLNISTPSCGRSGRNGHIYDQCGVTLARIKAKRLKMIAKKAAEKANQKGGAKNKGK